MCSSIIIRSVAGGILFSPVRPCVRPSVCASRNIVTMTSCRVFDTFSPNLHQRCTMGQRGTRHILESKGQMLRSLWNANSIAGNTLETALIFHNSSGQRHTILDDLALSYIHPANIVLQHLLTLLCINVTCRSNLLAHLPRLKQLDDVMVDVEEGSEDDADDDDDDDDDVAANDDDATRASRRILSGIERACEPSGVSRGRSQ